jgi:hypothetical protein
MAQPALNDPHAEPGDELFEMANLYPKNTGLPMTVWVSTRGGARHDVRIKANQQDGERVVVDETATIAVRPKPRIIHGQLTPQQRESVVAWIELNSEILVALWNGEIDFIEFATAMKKL